MMTCLLVKMLMMPSWHRIWTVTICLARFVIWNQVFLIHVLMQYFKYAQGPEVQKTSDKWARPPPPELDPKKDRLTFQQLDIDYYTDKPMKGMPGAQTGTVATMRIFGVTRQQNSICCHVHGFAPYLYVTVPTQFTVTYLNFFLLFLQTTKLLLFFIGRND